MIVPVIPKMKMTFYGHSAKLKSYLASQAEKKLDVIPKTINQINGSR